MNTDTRLCILVVDDNAGVAKAIARLLRIHGHEVHVAYSVDDGLELASAVRPRLILQDLVMQPVDGYEAARRLRRKPELEDTVLIACSGSVDEASVRMALFDGWLHKPVTDEDLDAMLATVLARLENGDRRELVGCENVSE